MLLELKYYSKSFEQKLLINFLLLECQKEHDLPKIVHKMYITFYSFYYVVIPNIKKKIII